jgi:pimeloyl-ACP methyl ester carboxylesterase
MNRRSRSIVNFPALIIWLIIFTGSANTQSNPSKLPLKPCQINGIKEEVLCGTHEVYENREAKEGRKISLKIVVLPALTSPALPDPLFALAGGPGQAATDGAANDAQRFAEIRKNRDIVLIDQRGTGGSNKLKCELGRLDETVNAFVAGDFSLEKAVQCRAQLERNADLRFYTTPIAMDDLDEVRNWLGYQKINVYGGSYGANAAMVYLQRHPKNVRTVALRAISSQSLLNNPRFSQQTLDRLFDDCAKDANCLKAYPNLRADFQTVLDNLDKTPQKVSAKDSRTGETVEILVTRKLFAGAINRFLNDSNSQRSVPSGIQRAVKGDYSFMGNFAGQFSNISDAFSLGMNLSITCPEGGRQFKEKEIEGASKGTFQGDTLVRSVFNICQKWTNPKLPKNYFAPIKSDIPVLIFSGTIDPSNPVEEGDRIAKYLPNSLHLKMEGIAHDFPACGYGIMAQFINTGSKESLNVACLNELKRKPFVIPQP